MFSYVVVVAIAACLLTVGVGVVLVRHRLAAGQLSALEREAGTVAAVLDRRGPLAAGERVFRVGSGRPLRVRPALARDVLERVASPLRSQGTITLDGHSFLYAARATTTGGVVLIRRAGVGFGVWRPFLLDLVLAALGGVALAAASSWLLARRLTRPIGELALATAQVAAGDAEVELAGVHGDDELARLARAFQEMARKLAASRVQQRAFLESVSHELKTPLTSIRGYAEGLADGAIESPVAAQVIGAEAGRLERLVADLLDLARLQRAEFSVEHAELELGEIASRAVERHRPRARELSVELVADRNGPAPGSGDADRLLQATSNLIENALRVTPAGGAVTVSAAPGAISVTDTGPGLSPEDLPRAFERFYLYDRYASERPVGSGLGLAIVAELADRMGGEVSVENVAEGGARFTLRVRVSTDAPGGAAADFA